jgi:hypothetical protein
MAFDEIAHQLNEALSQDFPGSKLKHEARPQTNSGKEPERATLSQEIDSVIASLNARIRILEKLRESL